jgi:hypothetical protein
MTGIASFLAMTEHIIFICTHLLNLPSASAIAIQRQELANRKKAPKALTILADPVYSNTDERFNSTRNKQLNKHREHLLWGSDY